MGYSELLNKTGSFPKYLQYFLNMNDSNYDYDYYFKTIEAIQDDPFVHTVGTAVFLAYFIIIIFGVPANIYVLCKLNKLAREDKEKYKNGTGSGLFAMAMADLLSLFAISLSNILSGIALDQDHWTASLFCKVLTFTIHTVTSISIWSWLLVSTLRYLAIHRPLFHMRLWRAPHRAILIIILMSSVTNVWLLIAVDSEASGCAQYLLNSDGSLNRWLHLIECVWSFCLPLVVIFYMDARVLICRPIEFKSVQIRSRSARENRVRCKAKAALWKWLALAFIDLLLNIPENLYRLLVLCGMPVAIPDVYNFSARMIAQVLYFSQFAFNAIYLAVFIYDHNIRPCTTSASVYSYASVEMKQSANRQYSSSSDQLPREWRRQSQREMRKAVMTHFRQRSSTESEFATAFDTRKQKEKLLSDF